jgi:chromosome segregation ATPase
MVKRTALVVFLLIAVFAAMGSLLSHSSHPSTTSDALVQALSQKIEEQDAKLSQAEEALRQLQATASGSGQGLPESKDANAKVSDLRIKAQRISHEEYRLSQLQKHLLQEQEKLTAWQNQLDLAKHRLDQDEKVLNLEVIAKAVDERNRGKTSAIPVSVVTPVPAANRRPVDMYGEVPFELPPPVTTVTTDYSSLQQRQLQLQVERKQWLTDKQALTQSQALLNRHMLDYQRGLATLVRNKKNLDDESNALKNPGLALRAKS